MHGDDGIEITPLASSTRNSAQWIGLRNPAHSIQRDPNPGPISGTKLGTRGFTGPCDRALLPDAVNLGKPIIITRLLGELSRQLRTQERY